MENNEQFYKMMELLPYGVGLYTAEEKPKILYLNNAFFKLLGYTREEYAVMSGRTLTSCVYPEDRPICAENGRKMREQGFVENCDYRVVCKDGSLRWVQLNLTAMQIDRQNVCLASFVDITAVKAAELASACAEDRYRLVMENTNTAVFEWNDQKKSFYCSALFRHYALSTLTMRDVFAGAAAENCVHPEDAPAFRRYLEETAAHKAKTETILRLRMTDGSYRWSRFICLTIAAVDGTIQRVIGAILDIDEDVEKTAIQQELMKAIPGDVAIFKVGEKLQCLYYNEGTSLRPHCTQEAFQTIFDGEHFEESLVAPEDRELFQTEVLQKAKRSLPINVTYRYKQDIPETAAQNRYEWVHLTATKIREEDGCPVYYAVMTVPPQENMLYRSIVEGSLTAAVILEENTGNILLANHSFRVLFGQGDKLALVGKNIKKALPPKTSAELLRQAALLTDDVLREDALTTETGRYLLVKGKKLLWNGVDACLFYLSDQTVLQKRNEELMKLLDDIPGGIGIYELCGGRLKQMYLNEGFFRMLGTTREQMPDFDERAHIQAVHPDDLALFSAAIENVGQGQRSVDVSYRIRNHAREYIWFRLLAKVSLREDGQTVLYCSYFDVDEQMKTQLDLDRERTILQLAMQTAKMSSWEYDAVNKVVRQDETSRLQHGYGTLVENVPESLIADGFVHPDSASVYRRLFRPMKKGEGILRGDVCVRTPDRKGWWWERVIITPVFDANGEHIRSIGTTIDVTEQKTMEAKYQQQVQVFNAASSPNLISKGLYDLTRNRAEYYHGETEDSVKLAASHTYAAGLAAAAERCAVPEEKKTFLAQFDRHRLLQQYRAGNTETVVDYQRKTVDKRIIWAQTTARLYVGSDAGDVMCFIYSYNINEQKTAREMIDTVVRVDYDYLALLDCRTRDYLVYANQETRETSLPPFHSSDYEQEVAEYARAHVVPEDIERNIHDMSLANIKAELEKKELYISYAGVRENDGSVSRKKLQFSYLDRAQEKVLITRMDVTDVYEREQGQMKKIQEANSAKNDFLSHMSHDLRTPMNAIIGLSRLAQDELENPEAMRTYVENIQSAGQFLLGLVNDCLDFEKLSAHKMTLHPVPYPYQEFRSSIVTMIAPLCQQKNIAFSFSEAAPYTVSIDKVRFEQIFFNLLSNAVKYTPEGGKIDFVADSHLNADGSLVICDFYVRDNGIGMSEAFQKKLFEPFEQESADQHAAQQSTGLGLSIVKELVELMGGTIRIRSRQGKGTEVMVHLDMPNVASGAAPEQSSPALAPQERLAGRTVLLLEDNPLNMMIAQKLLEKQGVTVVCGENGRQGLEHFAASPENRFDAILTDIRMPVMSGTELAKEIRALPRADARTVPIIAMTANAFEEDVQESRKAGMDAHLSKPIDPELLYKTLQACIRPKKC